MRPIERIALWTLLALAVIHALRTGGSTAAALASSASSNADAPRIAVCAVLRIADELMDSDRYKPARQEYEDSLNKEELAPIVEQLKELQSKLEGMARDNPEFARLREQYLRLQREAGAKQQEILQKVEKKVAEQLAECYALVRASAVNIAEDHGYDFVLASSGPDDELKKESPLSLVRDILSRPVLKSPKEADITEDVREELKL